MRGQSQTDAGAKTGMESIDAGNESQSWQLVIQRVKEQIANGAPPEVGQTHDRLIADGYPKEEAYRVLACVLSTEVFEIMKQKRVFDRQLCVRRLRELPKWPWE